MVYFPPTIILRHRKENLRKCSLSGLENRADINFFTYPKDSLPDLSRYALLTPGAPPLSQDDQNLGLFLIDGTWRYAEVMKKSLPSAKFVCRSIPNTFKTAYPRRQEQQGGLASVEALFLAYILLGRDGIGLLDNYHWKELFLQANHLDISPVIS